MEGLPADYVPSKANVIDAICTGFHLHRIKTSDSNGFDGYIGTGRSRMQIFPPPSLPLWIRSTDAGTDRRRCPATPKIRSGTAMNNPESRTLFMKGGL
ncbi:hypothetical protein [Rhizobium tubonense]|uniref:Uncharacterized protein n=1 Tax=Rhizobium tubonense TaxID=484088 RepID=A0A2W4F5X1_9HYPH|nr:hypothetical protein [Rhizobium tubonense]PZM16400.1 hypothetical protein CPY51_03370 [Rhizobium tubonense]